MPKIIDQSELREALDHLATEAATLERNLTATGQRCPIRPTRAQDELEALDALQAHVAQLRALAGVEATATPGATPEADRAALDWERMTLSERCLAVIGGQKPPRVKPAATLTDICRASKPRRPDAAAARGDTLTARCRAYFDAANREASTADTH